MGKGYKRNVGHQSIYNCHNGRALNAKMNKNIVDAWFPADTTIQEYYILKKIYELAGGQDNKPVRLPMGNSYQYRYQYLSALYMTYDTPAEQINGKTRYDTSQENLNNCVRRAVKRFDEMKKAGVLDGNIKVPSITFYGTQKLQNMTEPCADNSDILIAIQKLQDDVKNMADGTDAVSSILQEIANNMTQKVTLMQRIDDLNKLSSLGENGVAAVQFVQKHWLSISTLFSMLIKLLPS